MEDKHKLEEQPEATVDKPSTQVILTPRKRCWVFVFIIVVNVFINFDHGYFPAATEEFQRDFDIKPDILGLFGSAVYFGNLLGKIIITNRLIHGYISNRSI